MASALSRYRCRECGTWNLYIGLCSVDLDCYGTRQERLGAVVQALFGWWLEEEEEKWAA